MLALGAIDETPYRSSLIEDGDDRSAQVVNPHTCAGERVVA
jgi:hypothetical protein